MSGKYKAIEPIKITNRSWVDKQLEVSPAWCAVDLRDGNQALPNPLTLAEKKEYFQLLLDIGFKEIEIGFPSASKEEFDFCRYLIEEDKIPDDVLISVLAPSRPDLIIKTIDALVGAKKARVHIYIATSHLHCHYVLKKTNEQITDIVMESIDTIQQEVKKYPQTKFSLEFSPEEFTDTDLDFSIDLCDKVVQKWNPQQDDDYVVLNLPATVERRPPTHYADMIEVVKKGLKSTPTSYCISLHAHNDMGTAVAATQLALQAGGQRVEGTLFGHGERSGNVDLVTLALNLQYFGIDTGLDFSNLVDIAEKVAELTNMKPHPRHPYTGDLVFSAFSGSHQDAIHKCMEKVEDLKKDFGKWKIPYLHIDPADIGRKFEKLIRINSQSGKGGIAHIIKLEHNIKLPRAFQIILAERVQAYAEKAKREITSDELWQILKDSFITPKESIKLIIYRPIPDRIKPSLINGEVIVKYNEKEYNLTGQGNGPISALVDALQTLPLPKFVLDSFSQGAVDSKITADAIAFITIKDDEDQLSAGIAFDSNIGQAAAKALIASINNML